MRLDAASTRATRLLFCTTGILLGAWRPSPHWLRVSHVIVDEVGMQIVSQSKLCPLLLVARIGSKGSEPLLAQVLHVVVDDQASCPYRSHRVLPTSGGRRPGQLPLQDRTAERPAKFMPLHLGLGGAAGASSVGCHRQGVSRTCWQCAAQVHERTLQGDFLMALLKDILARRRAQGRPLKARVYAPSARPNACMMRFSWPLSQH